MDPNLVAKRRSTIFQRIQFEFTQSSVIEKRLLPGKFPSSIVGIIKIITLILLLSSFVIVVTYGFCPDDPDWSGWLFMLATGFGFLVTFVFFIVFTLGIVLKHLVFWFFSDILMSTLCAASIIISSVINLSNYDNTNDLYEAQEYLGICGSIFLLIESVGLYIMYKHKTHIRIKSVQSNSVSNRRANNTKPDIVSDV